MKRSIVYFVYGQTLQNTLQRMTRDLILAFQDKGVETRTVYITEDDSVRTFISDVEAGEVRALVSINIYSDAIPFFSKFMNDNDVHYFFYGTDHPYHAHDSYAQMLASLRNITISLTGKDEVSLAGALFDRPDCFCVLPQGTNTFAPRPATERDIPGLIVGNNPGQSPAPALRAGWVERYGAWMARNLDKMVEAYLDAPMTPMDRIISDVLGPAFNVGGHIAHARAFDLYLRSWLRERAITALLDTPTLVCGTGWEHLFQSERTARLAGSVDNTQVLALMARSQRLYSVVPAYYSCSERVLESLTMGVHPLSHPSHFFVSEFGPAVTGFDTTDQLRELAETPVEDYPATAFLPQARAKVLADHTWASRAAVILGRISD